MARTGESCPSGAGKPSKDLPGRVDTENAVASLVDGLALAMGWTVERYEQRRRTNVCEGLPDRRYVGPNGLRVWVELKRPGGKLTQAQYRWLDAELRAGGFALPVDDPEVLKAFVTRWRKVFGARDAADYCRQVLELTARRGFRAS